MTVENPTRSFLNAETLPVWGRSPLHQPEASFSLGRDIDLRLARSTRANLLLVGHEPALSNALASVMADNGGAIDIHASTGFLALPAPRSGVRTIVLRDVDVLTSLEQHRVLDWLTLAGSHTRVISTAGRPLLPMVREQAFSAALYYRLNVLFFDLTS